MPTPQRESTRALEDAAQVAPPNWSRLVAEALERAADGTMAATDNPAALYHRTFPLGEAIGELFKRHAACANRPLGLVDLVGALAPGGDGAGDAATALTRQALLAGLCWNLEDVVVLGSRLSHELGELPAGNLLDTAHARARDIDNALNRRKR